MRDLRRIGARYAERQFRRNVPASVREARHARRMCNLISRRLRWTARGGVRARRRRPCFTGLDVAQVNDFPAWIGDGIIRPRRQPKEIAVLRTRETAAAFGDATSD